MVGSEDVAVRGDDEARAETLLVARLRLGLAPEFLTKETMPERVTEQRVGPFVDGHGGVDIHHAGRDLLDDRGNARGGFEVAVDGGRLDVKLGQRIPLRSEERRVEKE